MDGCTGQMESSSMDVCVNGVMGVPSRSPLSKWASPPTAHIHHAPNAPVVSNNGGGLFMGFTPSQPQLNRSNPTCNLSSINDVNSSGNTTSSPNSSNHNNSICSSSGSNYNSSVDNNDSNNNVSNSEMGSANPGSPRHNQVGTILLHGVAIVSLVIDSKERLCLAQISNTLLKDYSYNEIHNRRVALGITCVQCTPVQLEILRRAGAMPVSSRRCGMITKREAERLVKSFLEENTPPKLPDDFAFDVYHECGWGCRGLFEPSRYNSSRAKCIKCTFCNMFFSPNKFIFHFHRTPDSKYNHPDAANFNSWRRHLKLFSGFDNEEVAYKWEDVKAMFNGGTRKRMFTSSSSTSSISSGLASASSITSSLSSSSSSSSAAAALSSSAASCPLPGRSSTRLSNNSEGSSAMKKPKQSSVLDTSTYIPKPPPFPNPFHPYNWLAAATPGKSPYPFMTMNSTQSMCFGFPQQHGPSKDSLAERMKASAAAAAAASSPAWMSRNPGPFPLSSMDMFWDKAFTFPQAALGFGSSGYTPQPLAGPPHPVMTPEAMEPSREHPSPHGGEHAGSVSPNQNLPQNLITTSLERAGKARDHRMSAFKRVVPSLLSPSSSSVSPHLSGQEDNENPSEDEYRLDDGDNDNDDDDDDDNMCAQDLSTHHAHKDNDDAEEIDVEENGEDKKKPDEETDKAMSDTDKCDDQGAENNPESLHKPLTPTNCDRSSDGETAGEIHSAVVPGTMTGTASSQNSDHSRAQNDCSGGQDSGLSDESDTETENQRTFGDMTKEQLCKSLRSELESRRRREKEVNVLKDTFREEVNREKTFREHMAQQLEVIRETLTSELEQERKIRYSLQQKLKEAHDALQNFSCGLLAARRDGYALKDSAILPR